MEEGEGVGVLGVGVWVWGEGGERFLQNSSSLYVPAANF